MANRTRKHDSIEWIVDAILSSEKIVALTGAGVSTDAGIPDFRSPVDGLWERTGLFKRLVAFTSLGFYISPKSLYRACMGLLPILKAAEPTSAHLLLSQLEDMGKLNAVITQNVDGLHQMAGSLEVIELHGNIRMGHCIRCDRSFTSGEITERLYPEYLPPRCDECRGAIKPNVVLFGDQLPADELAMSYHYTSKADLFIVMGSSLAVWPAAHLPRLALKSGARLIIINNTPTPIDHLVDAVIHRNLTETADRILKIINNK